MKEIMREWYASGSEDIKEFEAALDICCKQAHRAGWGQAKREAYYLIRQYNSSTKSGEDEVNKLAIAIAAMEYKGPAK